MDVVTKATATVTPVEDPKSKHGEFDVILSTAALDRDGDELHPDEWKTPLPDKITFDSDHGMSVATCVGSGKPFINDDGQLQVRGTFASTPHGQAVRTLVNEGHISNVSVAFMSRKNQKSGAPLRELLNGAFVAVPANPEAVVLSSKSANSQTIMKIGKKSIDGSLEDLTRRVSAAVCAAYGQSEYPWVCATFLDDDGGSGTVVYEVNGDTLARAFRDDNGSVELDPDTRPVSLVTTVVGKSANAANWDSGTMDAVSNMFENDPLDGGQPGRPEYWQGVHDIAVKLGAGCPYHDPQTEPDVLNVSNRSVSDDATETKTSPPESAEESTETAAKAAVSADESADDVVMTRAKALAILLGALA